MPRRARLALAGIPWHIIQRGNNRSVCFHAEDDFQFYLYHLKEFADKFGCALHAYVLMTNHVHLLLTPQQADSAGLMMKHLGQRYVQYINRTYRRSGTLWEGRFRSCLTQSEDYVLACYRYIELNPVRAGMVMKPEDYRWSSYHANGLGKANALIAPHTEYLRLGTLETERRRAYRELFRAHVDEALVEEIRGATNGNFALGGKRFQAQVEAMLGRRAVRGVSGRPRLERGEGDEAQQQLL
ncbi:MAG: transposase [Rhodocyclaceae bacterium]|nr:transposase [Rhodocyclaceae bacterium]